MPIKPENKHRYPPNWPEISAFVLDRARHRCECVGECGKHPPVARCGRKHHEEIVVEGEEAYGCYDMLEPINDYFVKVTQEWSDELNRWIQRADPRSYLKVILTVAHLDHTPENCLPSNLKAMCQRCHRGYDAKHHAQTRYLTNREGKAMSDLFEIAAQQPRSPAPSGLLPRPGNDSPTQPTALPMLQAGPRREDRKDPDDEQHR